jgi:hypothetical protein
MYLEREGEREKNTIRQMYTYESVNTILMKKKRQLKIYIKKEERTKIYIF